MSARPETLYKCDRCGDELHVVANTTVPEHKRLSGPEGWLQIRIGDDPSTPPSHLCSPCAFGFNAYMEGVAIMSAKPLTVPEEFKKIEI